MDRIPLIKLKKVSLELFHSPVIVQIGNSQIAIGHGIARRILAERMSDE